MHTHVWRLLPRFGLLLAVMVGLAPGLALACGMPLEARIPSEQALIVFADGRQEIITSVQLEAEGPGAAVVFPVPGVPEVSVVESDRLFSYLDEVTQPLIKTEERLVWSDNDTAAGGAPGGVSVIGREIIAGYDVARLDADDPGALEQWLDQNGYAAPPGAGPILQAYIADGWKFVAVKLADGGAASGALQPIRMAFSSDQIVYPMRLGALADQPLDVLLYVLANGRVEVAGMDTQYAGPVAALEQAPPADLAPLFRAPYLTRLRNSDVSPASLEADFVALPAESDEPFRAEATRVVYVSGWNRAAGPAIAIICIIVLNAFVVAFALGMRRRFRRIVPDPDAGRE